MAITIEQAKALRHGDLLHYTGPSQRAAAQPCTRVEGPRGGVKETVVRVRVTGTVQTWKRDAGRVRVPVKHGMYESGAITEDNLQYFHLASECPAGIH